MAHSLSRPIITHDTAARLIAEAIAHAQAGDWAIAVVVVDPAGHNVASARMDGVSAAILDFANDKAYTAAMLGKPSHEMAKGMMASKQQELGALSRPRLCAWDGGTPAVENGEVIGAIGVSGAPGPIDIECGVTALSKFGLAATG